MYIHYIQVYNIIGAYVIGETGVGWDKKVKKKAFMNLTNLKTLLITSFVCILKPIIRSLVIIFLMILFRITRFTVNLLMKSIYFFNIKKTRGWMGHFTKFDLVYVFRPSIKN